MSDLAWALIILLPVALAAVFMAALSLDVQRQQLADTEQVRRDLFDLANQLDKLEEEVDLNGSTASVFDSIGAATRAARGYQP